MYCSVLEWLEETAHRLPQKVAFQSDEGGVTFAEVRERAEKIGARLAEVISPRDPVAVFTQKSVMTPVCFLGVVYAGACYAPIDAALPQARIASMLEVLQPSTVLADRANAELLADLGFTGRILYTEELLTGDGKLTAADQAVLAGIRTQATGQDPLYIIFTSGSSGRPKAVMTAHHSLMNYIEAYGEVMGIVKTDVLGNQSPLDYIAAIRDIYLPLRYGCSTVLIPKVMFMQPDRLFDYMNRHQVTSVGWSVSALTIPVSLGAFDEHELTSLKKVCFSGSVMPCHVLRKWQQHLPQAKFVNQYGPTEATASCTYYEVDHLVDEAEILPIGQPYKNYRIFLLKEDGSQAGVQEEGEICVAGIGLALGYYRDAERTAEAFTELPGFDGYRVPIYRTGDIGVRRADGQLEFHGRKDRQVKHLGHRIELDEVEVAAGRIDGVQQTAVLYESVSEQLYLFYTGKASAKELAVGLRRTIPGFMVPRKMIALASMPLLPNGKIDLQALREQMK